MERLGLFLTNKIVTIVKKAAPIKPKKGAININGVMYDPPHLKWALKLKEYLNEIEAGD